MKKFIVVSQKYFWREELREFDSLDEALEYIRFLLLNGKTVSAEAIEVR